MNTKNLIIADKAPYPKINVKGKDTRLAERLTVSFGGNEGEFGTIASYIYKSLIFAEKYPDYSEIYMKLAITEMHHLQMIGELIKKLGGQPLYGTRRENGIQWFSGANVNYANDPLSAFMHDMAAEQQAYNTYIMTARQSGDRDIFSLLSRIALDEMHHRELFSTLINSLRPKPAQ